MTHPYDIATKIKRKIKFNYAVKKPLNNIPEDSKLIIKPKSQNNRLTVVQTKNLSQQRKKIEINTSKLCQIAGSMTVTLNLKMKHRCVELEISWICCQLSTVIRAEEIQR